MNKILLIGLLIISSYSNSLGQIQRKDYSNIIERYSNYELSDLDNNSLFELADAYEAMRKYPEALSVYKALEKLNSNDVQVLISIARVYQYLGKPIFEIKYLEKALLINPEELFILYQLADANLRIEDYEKALEYSILLRKLDSTSVDSWYLFGQALQANNQIDEAVSAFDKALVLNPSNEIIAQKFLAIIAKKSDIYVNDVQRAIEVADSVLNYNPTNKKILRFKSQYLYIGREYEYADSVLQELMLLKDSTFNTLKYAGLTAEKLRKEPKEIVRLMELAHKRDTTDMSVMLSVAYYSIKDSNLVVAEDYLKKVERQMIPPALISSLNELCLGEIAEIKGDSISVITNHYHKAYQLSGRNDGRVLVKIYNLHQYHPDLEAKERELSLYCVISLVDEHLLANELPEYLKPACDVLKIVTQKAKSEGTRVVVTCDPDGRKRVYTISTIERFIKFLEKLMSLEE